MRYQLLALVHGLEGAPGSRDVAAASRVSIPALVEFAGQEVRKRVVAMIGFGRRLSRDEAPRTASLLCEELAPAFARRGLALSDPELVEG